MRHHTEGDLFYKTEYDLEENTQAKMYTILLS